MTDAKAKVRKGTLINRRLLSTQVWEERCLQVEAHLIRFVQEKGIHSCHIFLPIKRNNEFDSWDLVRKLDQSGVKVMISVSDFSNHTMGHYYYSSRVNFESNAFDIPEPVDALPADISTVEMVLIPLLAADKKGHRIGYGKGFYDRLLSDMPKNVLKMGVNLAPLFDAFSFAEAHDVRLDFCVTPQEIYQCHD
ncbi:5-formyltetrahydrofolate cyclo-ligase [Marinoscillum sp. MHG1-6]|uniref:5-formyltetrahydrofolate cyclo-ligase n=1 Tax=Marinoscillum sp. MHG1-6 TaxID=2959627 RepID=UPI0021583C43|nr:5-formyltetrahydrofolate cyclo-ligase [Marinoscillum sp. MHG1-6]